MGKKRHRKRSGVPDTRAKFEAMSLDDLNECAKRTDYWLSHETRKIVRKGLEKRLHLILSIRAYRFDVPVDYRAED